MSVKLYVGNLSFQTSSDDLQQLFSQAGTVESASVVEDRETGRSRGFGFVEMASSEEGQAAIQQFDGYSCFCKGCLDRLIQYLIKLVFIFRVNKLPYTIQYFSALYSQTNNERSQKNTLSLKF